METVRLEDWSDIRELAAMSIGTDKGRWWADKDFGSDLWILRQGKLDGSTPGKVRAAILEATRWMVSDGLVQKIDCIAVHSGKNRIDYQVILTKPSGDTLIIKDVWHGTI